MNEPTSFTLVMYKSEFMEVASKEKESRREEETTSKQLYNPYNRKKTVQLNRLSERARKLKCVYCLDLQVNLFTSFVAGYNMC